MIGVRSAAAIATFLGFYFNLIFDNVVMITANTPSEVFESLLRVGEEDVIIGVSFPRYSSRAVQAVSFARDRGPLPSLSRTARRPPWLRSPSIR